MKVLWSKIFNLIWFECKAQKSWKERAIKSTKSNVLWYPPTIFTDFTMLSVFACPHFVSLGFIMEILANTPRNKAEWAILSHNCISAMLEYHTPQGSASQYFQDSSMIHFYIHFISPNTPLNSPSCTACSWLSSFLHAQFLLPYAGCLVLHYHLKPAFMKILCKSTRNCQFYFDPGFPILWEYPQCDFLTGLLFLNIFH